jgi:hypothetical protein
MAASLGKIVAVRDEVSVKTPIGLLTYVYSTTEEGEPTLAVTLGTEEEQGWSLLFQNGRWVVETTLGDEYTKNNQVVLSSIPPAFLVEKVDTGGAKTDNVLEDPALAKAAPGITEVERLFTPITKWVGDVFYAVLSRLDDGTRKMLEATPKGSGKYFKWETRRPGKEGRGKNKPTPPEMGLWNVREETAEDVVAITKTKAWDDAKVELDKIRKAESPLRSGRAGRRAGARV